MPYSIEEQVLYISLFSYSHPNRFILSMFPYLLSIELKELVNLHAENNKEEGELLLGEGPPLTTDECTIIKGALDMKTKTVKGIDGTIYLSLLGSHSNK